MVSAIKDASQRATSRLINNALKEGRSSLLEHEAEQFAKHYGIPVPKAGLAKSESEAVALSHKIGFPLAMKIISPKILHKTDIGGVRLGVDTTSEVKRAFAEIIRNAKKVTDKSSINGVYLQKMAEKSHEFVVGGIRDPQFGPTVMFGMGGIFVELFRDVTFRLAPVTLGDAHEMTHEIRAAPLMYGFRGGRPLDSVSAARAIQSVGRMMAENEQIESIDINPLIVYKRGALAVDVRIILRKQN
ncbi:MAG: acetate--CoA ligase family protein [Nitrososphaerota archaeon]|nr:acetate--CoA ligase family protein [Nitrososphaerota archaeon]